MNKYKKGDAGYLDQKKRNALLIMCASFLVIAIVFFTGFMVTKTKNNIMTVVSAVLSLPAAKFAVSYIILLPHHSITKDSYNKINEKFPGLITYYDLVFSNGTSPIGTQAVVVSDSLIIALTDETKADKKLFESSVKDFMEKSSHVVNVTLYTDETSFIAKAKLLCANNTSDNEPSMRIQRNAEALISMCL